MINSFEICSGAINVLDSVSLRFRPKTNAPIENGRVIATSYEQSTQSERDHLQEIISPTLTMKLLGLSGFMVEAAVSSHDASLIRSAVILHIIEDFRNDYRENYRYLVLIAYASKLLGVDLKFVVASVESFASERAVKYLRDFVSRNDDLNRLESFGIRADIADGVLHFVPV